MKPQDRARQLRPYIVQAAASLPDEDAVKAKELYPEWKPDTDYTAEIDRVRRDDRLYKVRQNHTSQAQYPPGIDTASLYELIPEPGQGDTADNPIPYAPGMALVRDKYYSEDGIVYVCIRGSGIPVYSALADLVGNYVNIVGE